MIKEFLSLANDEFVQNHLLLFDNKFQRFNISFARTKRRRAFDIILQVTHQK